MPFIHVFLGGIKNIIWIIFVEGVVRKMNIAPIQILGCRLLIRLRGKASEALMVDIKPKWISSC